MREVVSKLKPEGNILLTPAVKKAAWGGIVVEHHRQPPGECKLCIPQHTIRIALQESKIQRRVEGGRLLNNPVINGDIAIFPSRIQQWISWQENAEFILIFLEPSLVARAASESNYPERVEIIGRCEEDRDPQVQDFAGDLAPGKLQSALEYINENLEHDVALADLAEAVEMSPYHFARMFKQATGVAPHQYMIERRVEHAKMLLAKTELPIAEISYHLGFSSQSHFTAVFRKLTVTTPKAYREAW